MTGKCHSCIHQQSWINLFRILLTMSVTPEQLSTLGFSEVPIYEKTSRVVFYCKDSWFLLSGFLDSQLPNFAVYNESSILDLLEIWAQQRDCQETNFLPLLWALLRRREDCPYRICSKILHQLEGLSLQYLLQTRVA